MYLYIYTFLHACKKYLNYFYFKFKQKPPVTVNSTLNFVNFALTGSVKENQQKVIKDKLAKWKAEKELKKKLAAQEKAKNQPFKVTHVDYKELNKIRKQVLLYI